MNGTVESRGPGFDAVILAGGRGRRLGGADKAAIILRERRLVDRAVAAARGAAARNIIVVGPPHAGARADTVVREEPPFTGPLPALAAGIAPVRTEWMLLLACDLERPDAVCARLREAFEDAVSTGAVSIDRTCADRVCIDGVQLRDDGDLPQWLAGIYRVAALQATLRNMEQEEGSPLENQPLRVAFASARILGVTAPEWTTADIDTPGDLERARRRLHD